MGRIEIRTIRETEVQEFLELLCQVFELDPARAGMIFRTEPFYDLRRKWALWHEGRMVSCLTTVPIRFAKFRAIGVAGVATEPSQRGRGFAERLLETVLEAAEADSEGKALLFAKRTELYQKVGFEVLDEVVKGEIETSGEQVRHPGWLEVKSEQYQKAYEKWSKEDERRLLRDERRWRYWQWSMKVPYRHGDSYVVWEAPRTRELLPPFVGLPDNVSREWVGLASLTERLGLPLRARETEMLLMGCRFPFVPEMFLTDQF